SWIFQVLQFFRGLFGWRVVGYWDTSFVADPANHSSAGNFVLYISGSCLHRRRLSPAASGFALISRLRLVHQPFPAPHLRPYSAPFASLAAGAKAVIVGFGESILWSSAFL